MSYKVLALKWRPRSFEEVVGQQATLRALQHALDNNQVHHAYLFTGTRGVGKTSIARILAKCLNCEQGVSSKPCGSCNICCSIDNGDCIDVIEVDAASRTRVEDTRDLLDNIPYAPVHARFKIYIIDEVHMLSNHSFNALLKTLEEPPEHVKFILATTDPQKLPVTVLSRCLQFHLRNFSVEQISQQLNNILTQERIDFEPAALTTIGQCANGSMRDALSLLEQVIAFGQRHVTLHAAQQILGTSVYTQTLDLLQQIILGDARQVITIVRDLAANNADFNRVLKTLQSLVHDLSLVQIVPDALEANTGDIERIKSLSKKVAPLDLQLFYQATLLGVRDLPYAPDIVTGFEMIVLRMLAFQPVLVSKENNIELPTAAPVIVKPITAAPVSTMPIQPNIPQQNISHSSISQPEPTQNLQAKSTILHGESNWSSIVPKLELVGLSKVIAENCVVSSWEENSINLLLHEVQRPLLSAKHVERIQEALQKYLQKKLKVNITVGTVQGETPAAQGQRLQQVALSAAEESIRSDAHIQQIEQTFSAKIADIKLNTNE